jgi:DNA-binding beta-propeller fold protein YncE
MVKPIGQFSNRILFMLGIVVILAVASGIGVPVCAGSAPSFVTQWGPSYGNGVDVFNNPAGIAVNASGYVYVADENNNRIEVFTPTGTFVTDWGPSYDIDNDKLAAPQSIAVSSITGNVYVADATSKRIVEFTPSGTYLTQWGKFTLGDGYNQFNNPMSIAVSSKTDHVYVGDDDNLDNAQIQEFTSTGGYLMSWNSWSSNANTNHFSSPSCLAISPTTDNVYVADAGKTNQIEEFTPSGTFVTSWNSWNNGANSFLSPQAIAVSPTTDDVYVTDPTSSSPIYIFTSSGALITGWGPSYGNGNKMFVYPGGIAVNANSNIYVSDGCNAGSCNNMIEEFYFPPSAAVAGVMTQGSSGSNMPAGASPTRSGLDAIPVVGALALCGAIFLIKKNGK